MRGAAVNKQFGPGRDVEAPKDRFDALAWRSKGSLEMEHDGMHSRLVVTRPLLAQKDFRGTDCTSCHQVPENTVLGAVRFDYSLDFLFTRVGRTSSPSALSLTLIFGLGAAAHPLGHPHLDSSPLNQLTRSMEATDPQRLRPSAGGDEGRDWPGGTRPTTRCSTAWSASSASARPPAAGRAVRLSAPGSRTAGHPGSAAG